MERKFETPVYWKSTLNDIEETIRTVKKGKVRTALSAGGRTIYLIEYGKKNEFNRMANLSSAVGCGDTKVYADKTNPNVRPTLLLVGAMHGAEFEGTVALLNLIKILESGSDFAGNEYLPFNSLDDINLLIIPCLNPDGRARVPFDNVQGMSFEQFRYYGQGTWKDGTLAGWPTCKKIHPILGHTEFLGAYYNDDGINLMHDDFFKPMAPETEFLLDIADEFVPDATLLLHGGTNAPNMILQPTCVPLYYVNESDKIACELQKKCLEAGLSTYVHPDVCVDTQAMVKINAVSAVTLKCGELCITYETNQGLDYGDLILTADEIYSHHFILFETMIEYIRQLKGRRVSEALLGRGK